MTLANKISQLSNKGVAWWYLAATFAVAYPVEVVMWATAQSRSWLFTALGLLLMWSPGVIAIAFRCARR